MYIVRFSILASQNYNQKWLFFMNQKYNYKWDNVQIKVEIQICKFFLPKSNHAIPISLYFN